MGTTLNPFTGKIGPSASAIQFNPLAGEFQFSGGSNLIKFDPASGQFEFKGSSDPLAGIQFAIRLERYVGLYQDEACTIPCTADFDLVAAWRDELSGSEYTFIQPDPDKRPFFIAGAPSFDGIDDSLYCLTIALGISQALGVTAFEASADYVVWEGFPAGQTDCYWRFSGDGAGYFSMFLTGRVNGFPAVMPSSGLHVCSLTADAAAYTAWTDGVLAGTALLPALALGNAQMRIGAPVTESTVFQSGPVNGIWITDDFAARATIEAFAATLNV
jgi:hypothetical protein